VPRSIVKLGTETSQKFEGFRVKKRRMSDVRVATNHGLKDLSLELGMACEGVCKAW
jgi:hypothetical protein